MREEIERFFRSYRDAYNGGDVAAIVRHIAVPCLLLDRTATIWSTEAEVAASMERLLAFYRQSGFVSAGFVIAGLIEQGANDAATDLLWTIERRNAEPWRFHTGYNLRRTNCAWRIAFCSAYQEPAVRHSG